MKDGENYKIDESIKLISWGTNFQQNGHQQQTRELFEKYSKGQPAPVAYDPTEQLHQIATEESQVKNIETGFRKLKNEQIERLKDLRTEFEEIRKGNPEYIAPRTSRTPSMHSSSNSSLAPVLTPQPSKIKPTGGRELQILELEKKQLETMLQNSMKKIEELLQNEMQFKKTIHELKLQRDTRADADDEGTSRQYRKKEKQSIEQIRIMELERENLLSTINSYKEKVKYLENSLASCQQELKKILDEKRNYEELIRLEKDKFMNLEIEFRREKRQHQIMEKDKNAEINRLLKIKDIKEGSIEREIKNTIATLQEEVKTKDKRYALLLEQFQNAQKKKDKQQKQQQVKIVTEIFTKTTPDTQNKVFQQTITSILTRLTDLEKKPIVQIDKFIPQFDKQEDNSQVFIQLEQRISELHSKFQVKVQENRVLSNSNYDLQEKNQLLERQNQKLRENEVDLKAEVQKLKKQRLRKDRSQMQLTEQRTRSEPIFEGVAFSEQIKDLESQLNFERRQKASLSVQYEDLSNQNRQLRLKISKLEFEVEKTAKQAKFQSELQAKSYQTEIQSLNRDIRQLKSAMDKDIVSSLSIRREYEQPLQAKNAQISKLKEAIQTLQRQKRNIDESAKQVFNRQLQATRDEHNSQLNELTSKIQFLTLQNSKFQDQNKMIVMIERENEQLRQHLHSMRSINATTDQLWLLKEQEYQKVDRIMASIARP